MSSEPPTIHEVTAADVPEVIAHVRDVLAEFGLAFGVGSETDQQLAALPASYADHGGRFWVARAGSRLVGTCGVFPVEPGTYELRKMYLLPTTRGTGLGRRLLEESIAFVRARGGERIVLDTTEQMTDAIRFYERSGFVRDDSQRRGSRCSRGYALGL